MDRFKHLVKNKTKKIKDAGAHLYHAATSVTDGNERPTSKRHRIGKSLARFRGFRHNDSVEKMYEVDQR